MFCGEDKYPIESRTVTVYPGYVMLESRTTADWPAVSTEVSTRMRDVSPYIMTGSAITCMRIRKVKRRDSLIIE
jgi:hypothetical protein